MSAPALTATMRAMLLEAPGRSLRRVERPLPRAASGEVLIRLEACGVCRTDLHVVDGELPDPTLPLVPGHEAVGRIAALGDGVTGFRLGDRVGVPWLGWTCGQCTYCRSGRENLCEQARFTGYTRDGGYAEYMVADARFVFPLSQDYGAAEAAPLLCAGLIGYRSLKMAHDPQRPDAAGALGLYGFGAAAHIVAQLARHQGWRLFAFVKPGDRAAMDFARVMGAEWTGGSDETPPAALDAAIIYAPVGALVPAALRALAPGGRLVCAGIHMSDIPSFPYDILWRERSIHSVANLTRADGEEFLALAPRVPVVTTVETLPLEQANEALARLRDGRLTGAAVLTMGP